MLRLMLLRHAKAAWPDGVADEDRPLAARGRAAAPRMAAYLAENGLRPDLAVVSSAKRTAETWDLVRPALGPVESRTEPRIYEAPVKRLVAVVRELPDEARCVLLVGHNPGMQDLAALLAGKGERSALNRLASAFPTAALAVLDLPGETWAETSPGRARLERFVVPSDLTGGADD